MIKIEHPVPLSIPSEIMFQTQEDENTLSGNFHTQQFIDESMQQFADMTRGDNIAFQDYLEQFHELPRLYINEGIRDIEQQFDHRFSVYHDLETEQFSTGESDLSFEGEDIVIKCVRYKGTPGLNELLFKNQPIGYNKQYEK